MGQSHNQARKHNKKEIGVGRTNFEKGGITNIGRTFIKQGVSDPLPTIISNTQQDGGIL